MFKLFDSITLMEAYDVSLIVFGIGVLALAALLQSFRDLPFSFPILALALGYVAFLLPLGLPPPDPEHHSSLVLHLTELGVIISLMGVGLKIARYPNWRTWSPVWRMLGICMPLTIAGIAFLGWWMLGLAPAAALLLAAALAPTDPVLAADVQVGEPIPKGPADSHPTQESDSDTRINERKESAETQKEKQKQKQKEKEKEDELRFTLTAEAGLNDSLAFPFTYLAILILTEGLSPEAWLGQWLIFDVFYRLVTGVVAGVLLGWALSQILLRLPVDTEREKMKAGVSALAATLLLYGITESLGGYGFLAVFIGGLTIRHKEHTQQSHQSLHTFAEQAEQLFMAAILIALGGAIAGGLLAPLTWQAVLLSLLLLFLIRPAAGMIGLVGEQRLPLLDRGIVSFFGIRGIGCIFYLAYGLHKADFSNEDLLWAICGLTVTMSVIVHGILASPIVRYRDRRAGNSNN